MLPMTILRRLYCVLENSKDDVLKKYEQLQDSKVKNIEPILNRAADTISTIRADFTFIKLKADPENVAANLSPPE